MCIHHTHPSMPKHSEWTLFILGENHIWSFSQFGYWNSKRGNHQYKLNHITAAMGWIKNEACNTMLSEQISINRNLVITFHVQEHEMFDTQCLSEHISFHSRIACNHIKKRGYLFQKYHITTSLEFDTHLGCYKTYGSSPKDAKLST